LNPGFEQNRGCPEKPGQINLANHWFSPNIGTPDYFHTCSPGLDYGTEFNKKGGRLPHSGMGYAGLQFYCMNRNEYYEYMENLLDTALAPGALYCIQVFVSLAKANYAFKELGAVASVNEIKTSSSKKMILPYTPLKNGQYLDDQNGWIQICGFFKAKGNERFITLGDFQKGDEFWNIDLRSTTDSVFKSSYYFIDDVLLVKINDSTECKCNPGTR